MPVERALSVEEEQELDERFGRALEWIPVQQPQQADVLIAGLALIVEAVRAGQPLPPPLGELPLDELAADLGVLWGDELCRLAGWSWCYLTLESGTEGPAIVDPDRAAAVFPVHLLYRALTRPAQPHRVLELLEKITTGGAPVVPGRLVVLG